LATLSAFLYPVYLRVRSRMYAISCANQLRQIGIAIHMYAHDYGDGTPYSMPDLMGKLYPNYVNKELLVCPYFQTIAPQGLIDDLHQILIQSHWKTVWSSYWLMSPKHLDEGWRRGEHIGFAPVFAKRGAETPIVFCDTHQNGCPETQISIRASSKAAPLLDLCARHLLFDPGAPLVILRWGGNVSLVHKLLAGTDVILMSY